MTAGAGATREDTAAAGAGGGAQAAPSVHRWTRTSRTFVSGAGLLLFLLAFIPFAFTQNTTEKLTELFVLIIIAAMWNVLAGYAGLVSVGQQAFIGIGAYGTIVFADHGVNPFVAAILAALVAIPLYGGGAILRIVGGLPLLDISLFARAKILIVFALAILAACGVEALERLAECKVEALERLAEGDALERGAEDEALKRLAEDGFSPVRRLALRAVPFVIAIPLALLALDFYPECRPEEAVFRDTPGIVRLREAARRGERFAAAGWTLIPNVSEALGIDDVRGHFLLDAGYRRLVTAADPNAYGSHGTYLVFDPRSLDPHSAVLDLLGVRWLAAPPGASRPVGADVESRDAAPFLPEESAARSEPSEPGGPPLARAYAGNDLSLFERPTAFSRFFSVAETRLGGVEEVRRADRDTLARVVYVSPADQARLEAGGTRRAASRLRIAELAPERFRVEVDGDAPSLLVSTQKRFPPYWRTFLDGREVPAFTADGLFLGVDVPGGSHVVEGRFVVPRAEVAVSAIGILALTAVMIAAAIRR